MATPFVELSPAGQVRRLRRVASAALPHFGLGGAGLTPHGHGENTVFRADVGGERFAVRVHAPNYHTAAEIRSELTWLHALSDGAMPVPRPLSTPDGDYTVEVGGEEVYMPRQVSVLHWLYGRVVGKRRAPATYHKLGAVMARLHQHADGWERPASFERPVWDAEALFADGVTFGGGSAATRWNRIDPVMSRLWREAASRAEAAMDDLGTSSDAYGLIHGDLHTHNLLQQGSALIPFDFDDCGDGWLLYDIAVPLEHFRDKPNWQPMRDAFCEGYTGVRPLPDLAHLDAFIGARQVTIGLWVIGMSAINAAFDDWTGDFLVELSDAIRLLA